MNSQIQPVGALLRQWRQHRRLSQLDLACEADISTRHLSFVETGRAQPSREMLLLLAEQLDIPLRERNRLLSAAGYAPLFTQRELSEPAMAAARSAIELLLKAHEPYPALTIDRHWN
ncbi:helix-turn-helix transcriptional regulator, partial [Myxococcus sp. AM001]|nr:helix-turn-helix transcriptional regulator [Myxococcus sp. AM001]